VLKGDSSRVVKTFSRTPSGGWIDIREKNMLKENNIMKRAVFCILSIWLILMFNPLNVKGAIVFDNTTTSLG